MCTLFLQTYDVIPTHEDLNEVSKEDVWVPEKRVKNETGTGESWIHMAGTPFHGSALILLHHESNMTSKATDLH